MRLFLLIYGLSCPLLLLEHYVFHTATIEIWLGLSPALIWKGQLWRMATYAFCTGHAPSWAINLFWFFTLLPVLTRDFSSVKFWSFCVFTALVGALPIVAFLPHADIRLFTAGAIIFGLLVAWARLYGRERILMLGLGELSVRQAAIIIAAINAIVTYFSCGGLLATISLMCGGLGGWAFLVLGAKRAMVRNSQAVESERIARLEL
jgi:membrane associated rhomboid family serine protease